MSEGTLKTLKLLRWVAIGEGISYLLIFLVSMPLKYGLGVAWPNLVVGTAHGVLFVSYCLLILVPARAVGWNFWMLVKLFIASLLPAGTFYMDTKVLKPLLVPAQEEA